MKISIVTPTYNRAALVQNSVASSLAAFAGVPCGCEVIVVDDASTDDTKTALRSRFAAEIATGAVRLVENRANRGVTGSKNAGFRVATGDWVMFLDSDDVLLPGVGHEIATVLDSNTDTPLIFFRCLDENGAPVGTLLNRDLIIDLDDFLANGTRGESLPVLNRRVVVDEPYIEALKGYESLAYCRIISHHGRALVSKVIARRYDRSSGDRLSAPRGLLRRMLLLAEGHRLLLREFGDKMRWEKRAGYKIKAVLYTVVGIFSRVHRGNRSDGSL